ncbi:MAG TPA: hypothetical protein VFC46_04270 [Humisphaera sp.]|nr:hypothetical protein [Humisphaera sp.]
MGHCPDTIKRLINRFTQQSDQIRSPDYNETLIRIDYINPLMSELGWREQIQREIDATDRQIDQIVYQLYGLTDDEIAIVEAATG